MNGVLVQWFGKFRRVYCSFDGGWWFGVRPEGGFDNGEFEGDEWNWSGVAGRPPDTAGELWGRLQVFESSGVGVALQAEDLSWGEESMFVVIKCEETGKVVGEVEVSGAVASC